MTAIKERFDALYFEYINNPNRKELEEQLLDIGHNHLCGCCRRHHGIPEDVVEDIVQESFISLFNKPQGEVRSSAYWALRCELRGRISRYWKRRDKEKEFKKTLQEYAHIEPKSQGILDEVIRQATEDDLTKALKSAEGALVTEIAGKHGRKVMKSDMLRAMLREYIDVLMEESEYSATKTEWMRTRLPCFRTTDGRTLTLDEFKTYWDKRLRPVLLEKFRKYFSGRDESPPFIFFFPELK